MKILKSGSVLYVLLLLNFNALADADKRTTEEVWIDVRTGFEYSMGHVEGAHHIPYDEIGDQIADLALDKNTEIHLYCRSGNRSGKALTVLQELGYTKALNDGGINDLQHDAVMAD